VHDESSIAARKHPLQVGLSILMLAKRGPLETSCIEGAKASMSAMVAIRAGIRDPQLRATTDEVDCRRVWLACPPVSP